MPWPQPPTSRGCLLLERHAELPLHTVGEVLPELALPGEGHHDLGHAEREGVAAVDLPEVDGLAIGPGHLLEVAALDDAGHDAHEEHAAPDLELVGVPQRLLLVGQREEQLLDDDVLEADEARVGVGPVEDEALPHVLVEVCAEVVRLHLPRHVVPVEVERAQVLVDLVDSHGGVVDGVGRQVLVEVRAEVVDLVDSQEGGHGGRSGKRWGGERVGEAAMTDDDGDEV